MSRSIHTTKSDYFKEMTFDYSDSKIQESKLEEIRDSFLNKKRLKNQVLDSRKNIVLDSVPIEPTTVNINFDYENDYIHFPVSKDDIIELLEYFPKDILTGLDSINFCIGDKLDNFNELLLDESFDINDTSNFDDIIYGTQGTYDHIDNIISIFPFIYPNELIRFDVIIPFLRMIMLATLVHEIGHHDDFMRRNGRGRYYGINYDNTEKYAENFVKNYAETALLPFLMKKHADEYNRLSEWIFQYGGIEIPLESFFRDKRICAFGNITRSLMTLFKDVTENKSKKEYQENFALNLHLADYYDYSLRAYENLNKEYPNDSGIIAEIADTLTHLERYGEALDMAQNALILDENNQEAIRMLCSIHLELNQWEKLSQYSHLGLINRLEKLSNYSQDECNTEKNNYLDLYDYRVFADYYSIAQLYLMEFDSLEDFIDRNEKDQINLFNVDFFKIINLIFQNRKEEAKARLDNIFPFNTKFSSEKPLLKALHNKLNQLENKRELFQIAPSDNVYMRNMRFSGLIEMIK